MTAQQRYNTRGALDLRLFCVTGFSPWWRIRLKLAAGRERESFGREGSGMAPLLRNLEAPTFCSCSAELLRAARGRGGSKIRFKLANAVPAEVVRCCGVGT